MSDYLKSVFRRRWICAAIALVVFILVGLIEWSELNWILFATGNYSNGETMKILALFGLLHLLSYGAGLAVMLLYKNNVDTNIGTMGPMQKQMLVGAIQAEMDMKSERHGNGKNKV